MAGESRFTKAGVYVEIDGQLFRLTRAGTYTEVHLANVRFTRAGIYTELVRSQIRLTRAGIYLELAQPRKPTAHYEYNGVDITNYLNALDLQNMPREHEAKQLGSTGMEYKIGLSEAAASLKGDWNAEVDGLLAPDALRRVQRTGIATFEDGLHRITYTWQDKAAVRNWQVTSPANGKIEFSATLRHNGLGVRNVSLD